MGVAVATITPLETWFDGYMFHCTGTVAIDASPATYATGGVVMNMNHPLIKASRKPKFTVIHGRAGYMYKYIGGTDNSDGKLKVMAQSSGAAAGDPLTELAAAAVPAALSGDIISFHFFWLGQN